MSMVRNTIETVIKHTCSQRATWWQRPKFKSIDWFMRLPVFVAWTTLIYVAKLWNSEIKCWSRWCTSCPCTSCPFGVIKACRRKQKKWVAKFTPITKISCIPKWRVSKYELNYDATRHYSNILCQRRLLTIHLSEHRNGRWLRFVVGRFSMTYGMPNRIEFALYKTQ